MLDSTLRSVVFGFILRAWGRGIGGVGGGAKEEDNGASGAVTAEVRGGDDVSGTGTPFSGDTCRGRALFRGEDGAVGNGGGSSASLGLVLRELGFSDATLDFGFSDAELAFALSFVIVSLPFPFSIAVILALTLVLESATNGGASTSGLLVLGADGDPDTVVGALDFARGLRGAFGFGFGFEAASCVGSSTSMAWTSTPWSSSDSSSSSFLTA